MKRLLLDTNVVVWLLLGDRGAVSENAQQALTDEHNIPSLSAVSVWEIAIKRSLGKLVISQSWAQALTRLDFDHMPVTSEHAEHLETCPGTTATRSTACWWRRQGSRVTRS